MVSSDRQTTENQFDELIAAARAGDPAMTRSRSARVAVILAMAAFAATVIPAVRAARVDPIVALRHE